LKPKKKGGSISYMIIILNKKIPHGGKALKTQ
jgi:hypothetical protein